MFERILVPLDGSSPAEIVFPYVCEITSLFDSRTTLIRVPETNVSLYECQAYLGKISDSLTRQMQNWCGATRGVFDTALLTGTPALEILNCARERNCSLIVMANRGESERTRWPLGDVAAKVVRSSDLPVLLVKQPVSPAALKEKKILKRILVPLDGSRLSESALPVAENLALKTGADITLFRVLDPQMTAEGPGASITRLMAPDYAASVVVSSALPFVVQYMNGVKEYLAQKGVRVNTVIENGPPAGRIIEHAESKSIDLIVMSTHGWSGIGRWVFGSVAERVVHSSETPVLIIRPGNI